MKSVFCLAKKIHFRATDGTNPIYQLSLPQLKKSILCTLALHFRNVTLKQILTTETFHLQRHNGPQKLIKVIKIKTLV